MTSKRALRWIARELRVVLPLLLIVVARASFANHYVVPTGSMQPTFEIGDRIVADMTAYGVRVPLSEHWLSEREPTRGDVVLFTHPKTGEVLVKRLVGVPGDVLQMQHGMLLVNGVPQAQRFDGQVRLESLGGREHLLSAEADQGPSFAPLKVPPRSYFVEGDHRGNSADSRYWGFVPREKLLGRAIAILYTGRDGLSGTERLWIPLTGGSDDRLVRSQTPGH